MTSPYRQLAERIQGEVPELERVVQRALTAWSKASRMPEEDMYLDAVALNLHSFYAGIERLLELIANVIDRTKPAGASQNQRPSACISAVSVLPGILDAMRAGQLPPGPTGATVWPWWRRCGKRSSTPCATGIIWMSGIRRCGGMTTTLCFSTPVACRSRYAWKTSNVRIVRCLATA